MDDFGEGVLTPYPVGPEGKSPFFPVSQVCVCLSVCLCACMRVCLCVSVVSRGQTFFLLSWGKKVWPHETSVCLCLCVCLSLCVYTLAHGTIFSCLGGIQMP